LGIVFIEAQACGIPVIGTKIGGIPDVIQDGVNGLLISSRDSEAIYNAIKGIWNNPSLASEYVQNALQSVKKFDWDKIAENISAIYETTEP
jgi:glycosyltransferase involved in cell wall biosynthesis